MQAKALLRAKVLSKPNHPMAAPDHSMAVLNHPVAVLVFWLAAVILLFWGLGSTGLWNSEDRWVEIAREMQLSGNYFRPTINGALYFDKPLLSYWLVLLCAPFTGGINEWSLRLPSAFSGLLVLWSTIGLGRLLWSETIARLAGWLLLSCYGLLMWSRLGEADMENLAAATFAVYWYWRGRERTDFLNYAIFYLTIFIGAQTKGLAAVAVPLLAVLPDLLRGRRWRAHINVSHVLAACAGFLVYLLPFWLTEKAPSGGIDAGLLMVFRENFVRYFTPFDHDDPFYTYCWALPVLFMPWAPLLFGALVQALRERRSLAPQSVWLLAALASIFLFFSISGSRRIYYILPLLPYCALLAALFIGDMAGRGWLRFVLGVQALLLSALVGLNLFAPLLRAPIERQLRGALPESVNLLTCAAIGALALVVWWASWRLSRRAGGAAAISAPPALIGAALVVMGGFFLVQRVDIDGVRTEWKFARALRPAAAGLEPAQIAAFRQRPAAGVLFYADLPVPVAVIADAEALNRFLQAPPYPKLIVSGSEHADALPPALRALPPTFSEARNSWESARVDKLWAWRIGSAVED